MARELQHVDGEFEVDEAARAKLDVEVARRRFVAFHVRPHRGCVAGHLRLSRGMRRMPSIIAAAPRPAAEPSTGRARHNAMCSHVHASLR